MPKKIQNFARSALVKPITVNVGRAGAASLDVVQEVEYVKQEAKIVYILECLQKTPPPVSIHVKPVLKATCTEKSPLSRGYISLKSQIQSNLNSSNTDGSFTMANSNSFLSPYKILRLAQEDKYLGKFFYFIMKLYVVCTH